MAYFLRHLNDTSISLDAPLQSGQSWEDEAGWISQRCRGLIALCTSDAECDSMLVAGRRGDSRPRHDLRGASSRRRHRIVASSLDTACVSVAAPPTAFGANVIARQIVLKYSNYLSPSDVCPCDRFAQAAMCAPAAEPDESEGQGGGAPASVVRSVGLGLSCLFTVLGQLSRKDPETCCAALDSLHQLLRALPPRALCKEQKTLVVQIFALLRELRRDGRGGVASKASSCLIAMAVAHGSAELSLLAAQTLLCEPAGDDSLVGDDCTESGGGDGELADGLRSPLVALPSNYRHLTRLLHECISESAHAKSQWWTSPLDPCQQLLSFVLPALSESEEITDAVVNDRTGGNGITSPAIGSIASDGRFLFVLTERCLLKIGSGLGETVFGFEYAVNTDVRAVAGCQLYACRGALYLRHRQSTRLWVLDADSLNEIGEIMLPATNGEGILLTNGRRFYFADVDSEWCLRVREVDDKFTPIQSDQPNSGSDAGSMLVPMTDELLCGYGGRDVAKVAAELARCHAARGAVDVRLGTHTTFVLTRKGTVYYKGRGSAIGLEDVGRLTELSLPEPIVRMCVAVDGNNACFESASGVLYALSDAQCSFSPTGQRGVGATPAPPLHGVLLTGVGGDGSADANRPIIVNGRRVRRIETPAGAASSASRRAVAAAAVNASALVYAGDNGRVYAAGRHCMQTAPDTAQVHGLEHVHVQHIALGKTHAVALSRHGYVYTWGMNNMYQCGRYDSNTTTSAGSVAPSGALGPAASSATSLLLVTNATDGSSGLSSLSPSAGAATGSLSTLGTESPLSTAVGSNLCRPTEHLWVKDVATVCTMCGQCSAHGSRCPSRSPRASASPIRHSVALATGVLSTCGAGETGCLRCGVCRRCVERPGDAQLMPQSARQSSADAAAGRVHRHRLSDVGAVGADGGAWDSGAATATCSGGTPERSRRMLLPPARLQLGHLLRQADAKVVHVACGNYHSLLRCSDGSVISFGSNCHGQLGVGDVKRRLGPVRVALTGIGTADRPFVVQIATGANHSVLRTADGRVLTFGSNKAGQLARACPPNGSRKQWFSVPGSVPTFGPAAHQYGTRASSSGSTPPTDGARCATWIGAGVDYTLIKCNEQVVSSAALAASSVTANKRCMIIFPDARHQTRQGSYVVVKLRKPNRPPDPSTNGTSSRHFHKLPLHANVPPQCAWCLDPLHDILWALGADGTGVTAFYRSRLDDGLGGRVWDCPLVTEAENGDSEDTMASAKLVGLNLLAVLYARVCMALFGKSGGRSLDHFDLAASQIDGAEGHLADQNLACLLGGADTDSDVSAAEMDESERPLPYEVLDRFQNYGGGWGYSSQSVEAVQFSPDRDIMVHGLGLFGGRGEYLTRVKLLGLVGAEFDEANVELLAESDEVLFDCGARKKAHVTFAKPILCKAGHWYIAWAQITGPSSDCGAAGRTLVTAGAPAASGQAAVTVHFRNSSLSNNGTDVNAGQIPQLLYTLPVGGASGAAGRNNAATPSSATGGPAHTDATVSTTAWSHLGPSGADGNKEAYRLLAPRPALLEALVQLVGCSARAVFEIESTNVSVSSLELKKYDAERSVMTAVMCLRLMRWYVNVLYPIDANGLAVVNRPSTPCPIESAELAKLACDTGPVLATIFACGASTAEGHSSLVLLTEAVATFVHCFHVLCPCPALAQHKLLRLMTASPSDDWSLLAALEALARLPYPLSVLLAEGDNALVGPCPHLIRLGFRAAQIRQVATISYPSLLRFLLELACAPPTPLNGAVGSGSAPWSPVLRTDDRFGAVSATPNWEPAAGSPAADAIAFKVDGVGINLCGVGVYTGLAAEYHYTLEVLLNESNGGAEAWQVLEKVSGSINLPHCRSAAALPVQLNKPVKLHPNCVYAVRVYLQGGKTWSGDGGYSQCTLVNGVTVTFHAGAWLLMLLRTLCMKLSDCLSVSIVAPASGDLCSAIFAWAAVYVANSPQRALDVLAAVDELLPVVAAANGQQDEQSSEVVGFSNGCSERVVVQTEHPYQRGTVDSRLVQFGDDVHYMCLQFASECATLSGDTLRLYLHTGAPGGCGRYSHVAKLSGPPSVWANTFLLLPGNSVWFVLESLGESSCPSNGQQTAPNGVGGAFGYECAVTGFKRTGGDLLLALERELAWLCAEATAVLISLPRQRDTLSLEEETHETVQRDRELLRRGPSLAHVPTVREALAGTLPAAMVTGQLKFAKEFIAASTSTVAGRLARWLAVDPFIDVHRCELSLHSESASVGRSCHIALHLRDQFGKAAVCRQLQVEVAVKLGGSSADVAYGSGAANLPSLAQLQTVAYAPTYLNKARYISVTMMPSFGDYSFEEMRLGYFRDAVLRESVHMAAKRDATLVGRWIPRQQGAYRIECRLDGFQLPQTIHIQVQDIRDDASGPQENTSAQRPASASSTCTSPRSGSARSAAPPPPPPRPTQVMSRARFAVCRPALSTTGVRVRMAPSLHSQQLGVISRGSLISYMEELENGDGVWLRLTDEATLMHSHAPNVVTQSWALQYNKHTGKVLLDKHLDDTNAGAEAHSTGAHQPLQNYDTDSQCIVVQSDDVYVAVASASGRARSIPVRCAPSPTASLLQVAGVNDELQADGWLHNADGVWIRLARPTAGYCLAQSVTGHVYLERRQNHNDVAAHSHSVTSSGGRPMAQVLPQSRTPRPVDAAAPSFADACRSAFAALLWHERLVKDAMACAAYLQYSGDVPQPTGAAARTRPPAEQNVGADAPMALQPLLKLWRSVEAAVQSYVSQQQNVAAALTPGSAAPFDSNGRPAAGGSGEELCELCERVYPLPLSTHMRAAHPGCAGQCAGYGYNSLGRYTSGWSGKCGDGGRGGASSAWYLMCPGCRANHLRHGALAAGGTAPAALRSRRQAGRRVVAGVGGDSRINSSSVGEPPQVTVKLNAMFLLDLNNSADPAAASSLALGSAGGAAANNRSSCWTINLFPESGGPPAALAAVMGASEPRAPHLPLSQLVPDVDGAGQSCSSDPGPKRQMSLNTSGPLSLAPKPPPQQLNLAKRRFTGDTIALPEQKKVTSNSLPQWRPSAGSGDESLSGEGGASAGATVMSWAAPQLETSPSVTLQSLLGACAAAAAGAGAAAQMNRSPSSVLRRPALTFMLRRQDLRRLRELMRASVCRATLLAHAFRVANWILRTVSNETSVTDVLWHYVSAMQSYGRFAAATNCGVQDEQYRGAAGDCPSPILLVHPSRFCLLAGPLAGAMVQQFHRFLNTVCVIVKSPAVGDSLRRLCYRAWTFQLTVHEQDFLTQTCNVLSNVAQTLSEAESSLALANPCITSTSPQHVTVAHVPDVTNVLRVDTSSRRQMIACLVDGSLDTFWESGDEDKNRAKSLRVHWDVAVYQIRLLCLYVDNVRDVNYRVSQTSVHSVELGGTRRRLCGHALDANFVGWLTYCVLAAGGHVTIELRGPDACLRVRALRAYGGRLNGTFAGSKVRNSPSQHLRFSSLQSDAFALFQALAAQVFGDEFSPWSSSGPLRHQVLDVLFSRLPLRPLQAYVCSQIVAAVAREVAALGAQAKRNYSYCCGLLVMLSKICRSRCAQDALSHKGALLPVLAQLLVFSPQVVQCHVVDTIEKVLPMFDPAAVDLNDFVLSLLVIVAKAITVQVRRRPSHTTQSTTMELSVRSAPAAWRLDRPSSPDIVLLVRNLIDALTSEKYGERWRDSVRSQLAGCVMRLCTESAACPGGADFWTAAAALACFKRSQWLEYSAAWRSTARRSEGVERQLCDNHDDGNTMAAVLCDDCTLHLCRECYTVLHLSRRARQHSVRPLAAAAADAACPQVDVHDGCTRLRSTGLLVLMDADRLNGMVELSGTDPADLLQLPSIGDGRSESSSVSAPTASAPTSAAASLCRYCGSAVVTSATGAGELRRPTAVCDRDECTKLAAAACTKVHLKCGHACGGVLGESECLPCLICKNSEPAGGGSGDKQQQQRVTARQDCDDLCVVCFTDRLGAAPAVMLPRCGHVFHLHCIRAALERKWAPPRITFAFMRCPLCQTSMDHPALADLLQPLNDLYADVRKKALLRLEYDGLADCPAIVTPGGQFYHHPEAYAMDRYVYVLCHKCGKAYFGGESQCQQAAAAAGAGAAMGGSQHDPAELVCGGCSNVAGAQPVCGRHGAEYLEYKCRFCCSIAVYFCFGTTHFCTGCHDDFQRLINTSKEQLPQCPVGPRAVQLAGNQCPLKVGTHPNTGEEFALGCGICRNLSTF